MEEKEYNKYKYEIIPEDINRFDLSFKILLLGESNVGKEDFVPKAKNNINEGSFSPTLSLECNKFNIKIEDKVIQLQIWYTCGQEIYRSFIPIFYKNTSLAIIIYAINE